MNSIFLFLVVFSLVFAHIDEDVPRPKRGASGALHIVTNHAQPIHADVKSETSTDNVEKVSNEQVTPPEDGLTTYEVKSLRKSLSFAPPTTLTLIRSISRVVTLVVLFVSAILEFYPTFHSLITTIIRFMNSK
nr:uncharacterized protein LOC126056952 [Helicoverpa armigera]